MKYGKLTLEELEKLMDKLGGPEKVRALFKDELALQPVGGTLLKFVSVIETEAQSNFKARDHFNAGVPKGEETYIFGGLFKICFWNMDVNRRAVDIPSISLTVSDLKQESLDGPIIADLIGQGPVESSVGALWGFLKLQSDGRDGLLKTNGSENIFYARNQSNKLLAVTAIRFHGGWEINALHVSHKPNERIHSAGSRVFSRGAH